jgi:ABC-type polysaccharide/polyol phosphate transport system ATPase subunit
MDEGIGTGDARFGERAVKRMEEFIGRSRIVVLASLMKRRRNESEISSRR